MVLLSILVFGAMATLIGFTVLAATSARSAVRAVAGARAQLVPAAAELTAAAREIAERLQRLRPQP